MLRSGLFCLVFACLGCMAHSSSKKKLAEAVHSVNDASRWGRIGTVTAAIQPQYRARFLESRSEWGDGIQLADADVLAVQMAAGDEGAIAVISYSWYRLSTMTLHTTVVQQMWRRVEDDFVLSDEQVVKGDDELFARAPDKEPESASDAGPAS